jgi:radical SAM protein with 4Fe4S-binding SPASM domain
VYNVRKTAGKSYWLPKDENFLDPELRDHSRMAYIKCEKCDWNIVCGECIAAELVVTATIEGRTPQLLKGALID